MKKHIILPTLSVIASLLLLIVATACTQNGGHIGKIFGRWHIERIEADGMDVPTQTGNIFWAFQSDMFQMQRENGHNSFSTIFGLYRLTDDTLFLDFPQEDQAPFPQTGLGRENALQVLRLTGNEMVLLYNPTPDASLTYYLRKW